MSNLDFEWDLVVLAADKDMQFALEGLLKRPKDLGIRPVKIKAYTHPQHDPGCRLRSDEFLRPFTKRFAHAIVMFDREGCGKEHIKTREDLEEEVAERLSRTGWRNRACAVVIDPELENWVFSYSPEVEIALGWKGQEISLRSWLLQEKYLEANEIKPTRPKEAMKAALHYVRMARSASIYARLGERVPFERCTDPAFLKLRNFLQSWFPPMINPMI